MRNGSVTSDAANEAALARHAGPADERRLEAELVRERQRRTEATLLARLSETAARDAERELSSLAVRLRQAEREAARLKEELEAPQNEPFAAPDLSAELEAMRAERDAALQRVEEIAQERRVDAFCAWLVQPRVALGLLRRGSAGAEAAVVQAAQAEGLFPAVPRSSVARLAGRRTVLALQGRRLVSGWSRATQAARFRLHRPS